MSGALRLACVQLCTGNDVGRNIADAEALVREAAGAGADLVSLPECAALIEPDRAAFRRKVVPEEDHPALAAFVSLARELRIWMHVGSLAVRRADDGIANRTYLIDPGGDVVARYDKIHMFDVDLANGESFRESDSYRPGSRAVFADLPWGRLGLTICYDVRFPALYGHLARCGALFIAVPSAFTRPTGRAHWEVLLRARAIETGSWIFAAAQCGSHGGGRESHGHSLIVDPWGEVLADGGEEVGIVLADIDPARAAKAREAIPALANAREFAPAGQRNG